MEKQLKQELYYDLYRLHVCMRYYLDIKRMFDCINTLNTYYRDEKDQNPGALERRRKLVELRFSDDCIQNFSELVQAYNEKIKNLSNMKLSSVSLNLLFDSGDSERDFYDNEAPIDQKLTEFDLDTHYREDIRCTSKTEWILLESFRNLLFCMSTLVSNLQKVTNKFHEQAKKKATTETDLSSLEYQCLDSLKGAARFVEEFIDDDELKAIIKADIEEIKITYENEAFKSSCIMVVSVIESLLKETLCVDTQLNVQEIRRIRESSLFILCEEAQERRIIRRTTNRLVEAARVYRNSIHSSTQMENVGFFDMVISTVVIFSLNIVCRDLLAYHRSITENNA